MELKLNKNKIFAQTGIKEMNDIIKTIQKNNIKF